MKDYSPEQQRAFAARKAEFDKFYQSAKTDINLTSVFTNELGYTLWEDDPSHKDKKSTENSKVLFKRVGEFTEVIAVKRNAANGEYYYSNYTNSMDKGNIFNIPEIRFGVKRAESANMVRSWYDKYANKTVDTVQHIQPAKIEKPAEGSIKFFKVRELYDESYLNARGITHEVLDSPTFKGKIFNTLAYIDKDSNIRHVNNIAFPYFNSELENPVGVEVKNAGLSKFLAGSVSINSLWPSNLPESGKVDNLIIVESPINAPSIQQLAQDGHKGLEHLKDSDNLYIASGGSFTQAKIDQIQKIIDEHKPANIILANDKANSGVRYDINILGQLERITNDPFKDNLKATLDLELKNARATFSLTAESSTIALKKLEDLKDTFDKAFDKETFKTELTESGSHSAKLEVKYYNAYENNLFVFRRLEEQKGIGNIQLLKPKGFDQQNKVLSDWNDVLMDAKNLDKSKLGRKEVGIDNMNSTEASKYFDTSKAGAKIEIGDIKNDVFHQVSKTEKQDVKTTNEVTKTAPTFNEFVEKIHKEKSAILVSESIPAPVEKAFYEWQTQEVVNFKEAVEKNNTLSPDEIKQLNTIIDQTNEKSDTKIPLFKIAQDTEHNLESQNKAKFDTESKIDDLVARNGIESLERLDAKVDNQLVHQENNYAIDKENEVSSSPANNKTPIAFNFENDQEQGLGF